MRTMKLALLVAACAAPLTLTAATAQLLGWNNLGMHCMDSDYSVFSVLPPYNTIEAQLIVNGLLVTNGAGYTVTYEAVADPAGSFNSTAMGKGNYYTFAAAIYGANLAPEAGLAGWSMPGVSNVPQSMLFEPTNHPAAGVATPVNWFRAEGIPLSPYDDAHHKNPYPMMRLIARNASYQPIATNDIVLPVSDEMDCRACHASGTAAAAQPVAGWVWSGLPERDFRLNILRLHDERQFAAYPALYTAALAARGFNPLGLYRGVVADKKPVLCAACNASEALGAPSYGAIPQLTTSMHAYHAHVLDPTSNTTLDNLANRSACYRCHPGSTTRCLRGTMGGAVAADGSMEMQCQNCHGNMSAVGATNRVGWFMEPKCQSCHTGTATHNGGQIRFTSALTNGLSRVPADTTFATTTNNPTPGLSLYRFSFGHGGLQCSACHGSTHAEFPSTHVNDNVRNQELQGHAGVMVECVSCHVTMPVNVASATGGPHGMHPVGQSWVSSHHDYISNLALCQACHGLDYRGTVLSRAQADRSFTANFDAGTVSLNLPRGAMVSCYACHNGPGDDAANLAAAPTAGNVSTNTTNDKAVAMRLPGTGVGLTFRLLSQPANGSIGLSNNLATYFPNAGFVGTDTFTFAAYDGSKTSTRATGTVVVAQGPFAISAVAYAPLSHPAGWPVAFSVVPFVTNSAAPTTFEWIFGDGSAHDTHQYPAHAYGTGYYPWSVICRVSTASVTNAGMITITDPVCLDIAKASGSLSLHWSCALDTLLEAASSLGPSAQWACPTNSVTSGPNGLTVSVPPTGMQFFRIRRPW